MKKMKKLEKHCWKMKRFPRKKTIKISMMMLKVVAVVMRKTMNEEIKRKIWKWKEKMMKVKKKMIGERKISIEKRKRWRKKPTEIGEGVQQFSRWRHGVEGFPKRNEKK